MTDWQQLASIIAVLGGVVVTLRFLWQYSKRLWKHIIRHSMFGIGDLRTDIEALGKQVAFIVDELLPNGGASFRDSLNRIELRQLLQEQRQWAILSDMALGVFETDQHGEFIRVNRKYLRMTGRAPEEVEGSGWINTVAERDRERVVNAWNEAIAEEREFECSYMLITPDDDRVQVSVRTYKLDGHDGEPLGFLGMLTPLCDKGKHI